RRRLSRVVRACSRRSVTRTIGVPGTGIFYMSRTGTQTGMHSATPPADPARAPALDALGAVEECPFGHPRGEGQPAAVPLEPALGDAEADAASAITRRRSSVRGGDPQGEPRPQDRPEALHLPEVSNRCAGTGGGPGGR